MNRAILLMVGLAMTLTGGGRAAAESAAKPLPEGVSMLPADSLAALALTGATAGSASVETVPVEGQAFAKALRVRVVRQPASPWLLQLYAVTVAPVEKGDVLLATFWLRCVESSTGEGTAALVFEIARDPWTKSIEFPVSVGREWKKFQIPFASAGSYAAGQASVNLQVGFWPQTIEVGGLSVVNYARKVRTADLPRTGFTYPGREADAPWRRAAAERIEKLRKGDLAVVVKDASGKPLAGADVHVAMKRHAFGFGSAVSSEGLLDDTPNGAKFRDTVQRLFNKVVFENDLKWGSWGWEDLNRRARMFKAYAWLKEQGLEVRGHCLVWPAWGNMPDDVKKLKGDPAALGRRIADHVREEVAAMKGKLVEWDVINEPYTNHDVMDILGNDVMVDWFKIAREADPEVELFINDYSILSAGGRDTAHQDHYEKTIRFLTEKGAPVGGIGMQGHFGWQLTAPPRLLEVLDRFAGLGKDIEVTEFDIDVSDEQLQADYLRDFMTTLFSHPKVKGILMWGFWEGRHWKPQAALFRRDWSVKPNGQAWMDLVLKEWWTDASGKSDAGGWFTTRGFLGDYEVTVQAPLAPGGKGKVVRAVLPAGGTTVTVTME